MNACALVDRRKLDPDVRARLRVRGMCTAAVRFGDDAHDREPEARAAARARVVVAGEPLERLVEELRREAAALVCDVQLDDAVSPRGREVDGTRSVTERVVDEV